MINTFTKKIKESKITQKTIEDNVDIVKLNSVIERLNAFPNASTLAFSEIQIRTNPRKWVNTILKTSSSDQITDSTESLLNDFTDSMMTRMREEDKYALAIHHENRLILCHSVFGEETITPEWKIIPRMLDIDNVLRYVCFSINDIGINVQFWEKEATMSFIEWLGLPRKQAFLFGGRYRICSEIDGITLEFQLSEQEMDLWLKSHPEFKDGKINLSSPVQSLGVNEIRIPGKRFLSAGDFIQDFEAEKFGVPRYRREYEKIKRGSLPLLVKYFDDETSVFRVEGDDHALVVHKDSHPFNIVFADEEIEFRAAYLEKLVRKILNSEETKVFHAGMNFNSTPFEINHFSIYNSLQKNELVNRIAGYINSIKLQDKLLHSLLLYLIFKMLGEANKGYPLQYCFEKLADGILHELEIPLKITKSEDEIIEFKSKEIFLRKYDEIETYFINDITKKLNNCSCKIYLVGIEDNGTVDLINESRISSDLIGKMQSSLSTALSPVSIYLIPITKGEKVLLLLLVCKK